MRQFLIKSFMFLALLLFSVSVFCSPVLLIEGDRVNIMDIWDWLTENWAVIALVISELAAFLPGKLSGILQTIVKIGSSLFKKKGG